MIPVPQFDCTSPADINTPDRQIMYGRSGTRPMTYTDQYGYDAAEHAVGQQCGNASGHINLARHLSLADDTSAWI